MTAGPVIAGIMIRPGTWTPGALREESMRTEIRDDFDLRKIVESGQCFRCAMTGSASAEFLSGDRRVEIERAGETEYVFSCGEEEFEEYWRQYFDLGTDYAGIRAMVDRDDAFLMSAAEAGKGIRILRQDPFETLITFVISQRKNIPAIRSAVGKLCRTAGSDRSGTCFPRAEEMAAMTDGEWASLKLGYREKYLRRIALDFARGDCDIEAMGGLTDDDLRRELMGLYGVGEKIAECVMLFGFHRMNSFPVDVWIERALREHYPVGFDLGKYAPFSGVMQQYMYYAYQAGRTG